MNSASQTSPNAIWKLSENRGTAELTIEQQFGCHVSVTRPQAGLQQLRIFSDTVESDFRPLRVIVPGITSTGTEPISDAYVRGNDLVTTYVQTPGRTVRPQVYWSSLRSPDPGAGCNLVISAQTSLLASDPEIEVVNSAPSTAEVYSLASAGQGFQKLEPVANEELKPDTDLLLVRLEAFAEWSYIHAIHPTDRTEAFLRFEVDSKANGIEFGFRMFRHDLEKGVIRRGQTAGLFVKRIEDFDSAIRFFHEYQQLPPPLTT